MTRLLVVLATLFALLAPAHLAYAVSAGTYERNTITQINRHRDHPVRPGSCVDRYAEAWARHLKRTGTFYHRDQSSIIDACHARRAGEIIVRTTGRPRRAVRLWLNSPAHRVVLTNDAYRRVGVGAVRDGCQWLVVANFIRH